MPTICYSAVVRQLVFPTPWGEIPASLLGLALMVSVLAGRELVRRTIDDRATLQLVLAALFGGALGGLLVAPFALLPAGVVIAVAIVGRRHVGLAPAGIRALSLSALLVSVAAFLERPAATGYLVEAAVALGLIVAHEARPLAPRAAATVYLVGRAASLALRPDHPHVGLELALDLGVALVLVVTRRAGDATKTA